MPPPQPDIHLKNPPIIEAVIDIQCVPDLNANFSDVEQLHGKIAAQYPSKEVRRAFTTQLKIEGGKPTELSQKDLGVHGYLFKSADQKQIVQYRLDGFTFSRLKPYETWEKMRDEAKWLWEIYRISVKPKIIRRLAVRYINSIDLPKKSLELSEFFETYPKLSDKLPEETLMTNFSSKIELKLPGSINAIVRQRTRPDRPGAILFDIDLFSLAQHEPDANIWDIFDSSFWPLKDGLFRSSFTEQGYNYLRNQ